MILDAEVQVQVTSPPRPGLQVSLSLQPQARAILHTGGDAHLHTFVVDRQGTFAATKSLSKTDVDGGFGIEIDRGPGSGATTGKTPRKTTTGESTALKPTATSVMGNELGMGRWRRRPRS